MTVYFIGAGPGDPDLLTVKGRRLIRTCRYCLYAGSLVPESIIAHAPDGAVVRDTSTMHLEQIIALVREADWNGFDVARIHSGDPSLYGAIAEQIRMLRTDGINYEIVPGVPAYAAAAAAIGQELTIPEVGQTLILTRTSMKSSKMPPGEDLESLGRSRATLAIHLSIRNTLEIQRKLIPIYGDSCPVIVAYRVGWPDQLIIRTTLGGLRDEIRAAKITRTALIFVGQALEESDFRDSALYDPAHPHILRPFAIKPGVKRKSNERKIR